ncbi:hypothetical protein [Streptomyces sp. I05A-00742]|uniref:hypothetical protein n=1 Tax=Streptomyces sp. I05A-00742 TaxID=2732853 RepID=UPI001489A934|nr:hypothetical protein [Streptomyces sp. I05A-00742]
MAQLIQGTTAQSVFVDASTIDLVGEDLVVEFQPEWNCNALVEADPDGDGARVLCGQEIGSVTVTAQLWDALPPLPDDLDHWQDIAEVSVAWRSPFIDFSASDEGNCGDPAKRLELPGPGDYRLRVHGRNRDDGDPRGDGDPVEEYLIQMWPAPYDEPAMLRATSLTGAYWRR